MNVSNRPEDNFRSQVLNNVKVTNQWVSCSSQTNQQEDDGGTNSNAEATGLAGGTLHHLLLVKHTRQAVHAHSFT